MPGPHETKVIRRCASAYPSTLEQPETNLQYCVGVIDAVGEGVTAWRVGDRVGVGFFGGQCDPCRRGDFVNRTDQPQARTTADGGYAEVVIAPMRSSRRPPAAPKAYERMMSGQARFRVVLDMAA